MRKLVIILVALFALSGSAQEVKRNGKTFTVVKKENKKPIDTGFTIVIDGKSYPIYKGSRGGYYYIKDGKRKQAPKKVVEELKSLGV